MKIRTFDDQDAGRDYCSALATQAAVDVLRILDASGPDGQVEGDDVPSPAISDEYRRFRTWLAPNLVGIMLARVVGPLLAAANVDDAGRVWFDPEAFGRASTPQGTTWTLATRLQWLVREIPSLIETYEQPYDAERERALSLCAEGDALDLAQRDHVARAAELLPALEELYLIAQPGTRMLRGDEAAIAAATPWIQSLGHQVEAEERQRGVLDRFVDGVYAPASDAERAELAARIEDHLADIDADIEAARQEAEAASRRVVALTRRQEKLHGAAAQLQAAAG